MRTVAIVQARLGSRRFPHKILADLEGRPILAWVLERASQIPGIDAVALAMPGSAEPEHDVLARFARVAQVYRADIVLRVTADCPLLDPVVAAGVLDLYRRSVCDFASNDTTVSGYPDGWDVEVFSRAALVRADATAKSDSDREHVCPWMKRHLRCVTLHAREPWTGPKLSIDTPDDLDTVRAWLRRSPHLKLRRRSA